MPDLFVSIGECMVEMAPREDGAYAMGYAGDTFNTAWYARRAFGPDWKVRYVTGVGDDAVSVGMADFMAASGIDTSHLMRIPGKTVGLYLIQLKDGERSFAYWRSDSAARRLADRPEPLAAALEGAGVIYFSGITLAILTAQLRPNLLEAISQRKSEGALVVFDPNLRPRLWGSGDEMRAAVEKAAGIADIVLPSFDDEAMHFGDVDPQATIARYSRLGASTIVVKDGAGPVHCLHRGERHVLRPQKAARVVDTTAAGDSFNAAFLARLLAGGDAASAIEAGSALAAKVIARRGALVETGEA